MAVLFDDFSCKTKSARGSREHGPCHNYTTITEIRTQTPMVTILIQGWQYRENHGLISKCEWATTHARLISSRSVVSLV